MMRPGAPFPWRRAPLRARRYAALSWLETELRGVGAPGGWRAPCMAEWVMRDLSPPWLSGRGPVVSLTEHR